MCEYVCVSEQERGLVCFLWRGGEGGTEGGREGEEGRWTGLGQLRGCTGQDGDERKSGR